MITASLIAIQDGLAVLLFLNRKGAVSFEVQRRVGDAAEYVAMPVSAGGIGERNAIEAMSAEQPAHEAQLAV